ncbi:IS110 family transposase [Kitasatospora sp. NPDC056531]|uniref:IS110 family transposase n=1 Tax=Kitasatospora sp. NPDC056531 TaxID=3345856 RepID=UPI003698F036
MYTERTAVGLDVHARSTMAWALDGATGEVFTERLVPATTEILAWLRRLPGPVAVAYEAGPTGFGLARALEEAQIRCVLVAPSKMERPAGDRVKTDRRDAERLAKLLRLDELPAVRVPTIDQEGARDLTRARDDVRADLMRARHRLSKLLLRQGIVYCGGKAWTEAHHRWLTGHHFEHLGLRVAYDEALEAVLALEARRDRLDAAIAELAAQPAWAPVVARLACLCGISTLTAFGLAVEIGDWHRFTGATIGAYLGLVPTEDSSGPTRRQGSITKTGNTHARRLLVEAAWHHRRPYGHPSVALRARLDQVPAPVRQRAEQGNRRLHQRWAVLDGRRKRSTIAVVAVAREMSGWCWSLATMDP